MKAILTQDLTKYYGRRRGILGLSLEVERGEVFGFLGPNGAGKTTTIRLLLDLLRPTSGQAFVLGRPLPSESLEVRRRVGYLPGELAFYEELSGLAFLRYLAALRGGVDWDYVRLLAERLELDLTRPIRTLSGLCSGLRSGLRAWPSPFGLCHRALLPLYKGKLRGYPGPL